MSDYGRGNLLARALEGVTLALDSVRASKVRAALTILGVAIGVMVVIAMAATITGIQNSVSEIVQRAGPKSFYVMRYFRAGIQISDGSDEMSPWRRRPRMTREEAELISRLPLIGAVNIRESAGSRVSYGRKAIPGAQIDGQSPNWTPRPPGLAQRTVPGSLRSTPEIRTAMVTWVPKGTTSVDSMNIPPMLTSLATPANAAPPLGSHDTARSTWTRG